MPHFFVCFTKEKKIPIPPKMTPQFNNNFFSQTNTAVITYQLRDVPPQKLDHLFHAATHKKLACSMIVMMCIKEYGMHPVGSRGNIFADAFETPLDEEPTSAIIHANSIRNKSFKQLLFVLEQFLLDNHFHNSDDKESEEICHNLCSGVYTLIKDDLVKAEDEDNYESVLQELLKTAEKISAHHHPFSKLIAEGLKDKHSQLVRKSFSLTNV